MAPHHLLLVHVPRPSALLPRRRNASSGASSPASPSSPLPSSPPTAMPTALTTDAKLLLLLLLLFFLFPRRPLLLWDCSAVQKDPMSLHVQAKVPTEDQKKTCIAFCLSLVKKFSRTAHTHLFRDWYSQRWHSRRAFEPPWNSLTCCRCSLCKKRKTMRTGSHFNSLTPPSNYRT